MKRRTFLGALVATVTSIVAWPRSASAQSLPPELREALTGIADAPERKVFLSVEMAGDGLLVFKRVYI